MGVPIFHVDAFATRVGAGNPAAVCLLESPATDSWMKTIAAEMNLSETAFLSPQANGYQLRWFTPTVEVDLCGHATLASAHVLWSTTRASEDRPIVFDTRSGLLTAVKQASVIEMNFPATPAREAPPPAGLLAALGVEPVFVGVSRFDYLVVIDSEAVVRALQPDFAQLRTVSARGVIVSAPSQTQACDFVSRFFAPAAGVDEDPVTGSAHCTLAPYWSHRLGRSSLSGYQASARGGTVLVRVEGERVILGGHAVTVAHGELIGETESGGKQGSITESG